MMEAAVSRKRERKKRSPVDLKQYFGLFYHFLGVTRAQGFRVALDLAVKYMNRNVVSEETEEEVRVTKDMGCRIRILDLSYYINCPP